jgi:hypothetical protein
VLAQAIFERFQARPVYLVDYAVATQEKAFAVLREIAATGRCEIGAHLHPWITPPFIEKPNEQTSFSHNLPGWLQREKLKSLTGAIATAFGIKPISYRAGRYGISDEVAQSLIDLGYQIDMSVQPGIDMRRIYGPDFRHALEAPYWFGPGSTLLEIPVTTGFLGLLRSRVLPRCLAIELYKHISKPSLNRFGALGIFARLRLLDRIPLSPEGTTLAELRRLTLSRRSAGHRVFVLSYHSSSLLPGATEYVRSDSELNAFLALLEGYLEFFMGEIGGMSLTPAELLAALERGCAPHLAGAVPQPSPPPLIPVVATKMTRAERFKTVACATKANSAECDDKS